MNLSMFPSKFNSESRSKEQKNLQDAISEKEKQIKNINDSRKKVTSFGEAMNVAMGLGLLVGVVVCVAEQSPSSILGGVFLGFLGGIVWFLVETMLSLSSKPDREIQKVKEDYELHEKDIKARSEKERQEYLEKFESEAQNRSVKFADSALAQEVISWMSEGFYKNIDTADRRSHIEQISVPFLFSIYTNKITCNLGTYDFNLKRCENLKSAIDQTALARAIASTIQLNVMMKYPNDISGTTISIKIGYTYDVDCVNVLISYVAPNGNYKSVKVGRDKKWRKLDDAKYSV